jgi:2-dehydropantoate 2-reductase
MSICIYGAGAVGSHIAAKLLRAGEDVSVVARGPHLAAMRDRGLTFRGESEEFTVPVPVATDDPATLPPQDIVVVTLKTVSLPPQAAALERLCGPGGVVVFMNNGIPWWWKAGRPDAGPLPLLDPEAALWNRVRPERTVGGIIYSPNELVAPGVVSHTVRNTFVLGTVDGRPADDAERVAACFARGGMEAILAEDIRREVWLKLLLNAPGNPLSALTRLTAGQRGADPDLNLLALAIVEEVVAVARAEGWDIAAAVDREDFLRPPKQGRGAGRPSMLQDVLAGRPTEVESILGQVQAFARDHGVAVPVIDVVLPLMRGLDRAIRQGG